MSGVLNSFWLRFADEQGEFTSNQLDALELLSANLPDIYAGKPGVSCKPDDIKTFCQLLGLCAPDEKKERFGFLAKGIEFGNRHLGWNVPLSPFFHSVNREKNHLQPEIVGSKYKADRLIEAFIKQLQAPVPADDDLQVGQILLSAIMTGGLLDLRWLDAFQAALSQNKIYQIETWLWLEMDRVVGKAKKQEKRRWVADPLTQLLIYRYQRLRGPADKKLPKAWTVLSKYLTQFELDRNHQPQSLQELRRWGTAYQLYSLPQNLLSYARGDLSATSLPIESWLRIFTGKAIPVDRSSGQKAALKKIKITEIVDVLPTTLNRQLQYFKEVQKLISPSEEKELSKGAAKKRLLEFLASHKGQLSPALQLFILWGCQLLSKKKSAKEKRKTGALKVRSVSRYFTEIGEVFIRVCGFANPVAMEVHDLEDLYESMALRLEGSSYSVGRIGQFHGFLEAFYDLKEIEWRQLVDENGNFDANVDANIVSSQVYQAVKKSLGWEQDEQTRWQQLQLLAVILIYKCGLRPGEVKGVRIQDIQGVTKYELLVRSNNDRSLKTDAATRRIPLTLLLDTHELDYLLEFLSQRKKEAKAHQNKTLLWHVENPDGLLRDKDLFDPIRRTLREITKDQTLRLYHLRHSFVTWNQVFGLLNSNTDFDDIWCFQDNCFQDKARKDRVQGLIGDSDSAQKYQYVQSLLAGHNSPITTHKHYIHLNDWLLGYGLRKPMPQRVTYRALMEIIDCSKATALSLISGSQRKNEHELLAALNVNAKKYRKMLSHPCLKTAKKMKLAPIPISAPKSHLPSWTTIIETFDLRDLRRPDITLALKAYNDVKNLDGRQIKTARKVIKEAVPRFSDRWGGYVYATYSSAEKMLGFLDIINIPKSQILVIYHHQYAANPDIWMSEKQHWENKLKHNVHIGESANYKDAPQRGLVSIKVTNYPIPNGKRRQPKCSAGLKRIMTILQDLV